MTAHFGSKWGLQPHCPTTCHCGQAIGSCKVLSSPPHPHVFYEKLNSFWWRNSLFKKHSFIPKEFSLLRNCIFYQVLNTQLVGGSQYVHLNRVLWFAGNYLNVKARKGLGGAGMVWFCQVFTLQKLQRLEERQNTHSSGLYFIICFQIQGTLVLTIRRTICTKGERSKIMLFSTKEAENPP